MNIHADLSLFWVKRITASSTRTSGAPLQLKLESDTSTASITIFTDNPELTERLIAAINGAAEPVEPAKIEEDA